MLFGRSFVPANGVLVAFFCPMLVILPLSFEPRLFFDEVLSISSAASGCFVFTAAFGGRNVVVVVALLVSTGGAGVWVMHPVFLGKLRISLSF